MEESRRELISGVLQEDKELMQLLKKRRYLSVLAYLNGHGFDCSMDELEEIAGELTGVKSNRGHTVSEHGEIVKPSSWSGQRSERIHPTWKKALLVAVIAVLVAVLIAAVPIGLGISDDSGNNRTSDDTSEEMDLAVDCDPGSNLMFTNPGAKTGRDLTFNGSKENGDASEPKGGIEDESMSGSTDVLQIDVSEYSENAGESSGSNVTSNGSGPFMSAPSQYTVTLSPEGGKLTETEVHVHFGFPYGELPVPEDGPGYFAGWFYHPEDMTDIAWWYAYSDRVTANSVVSQQEPHTLYAHWAKSKCSPTFIASGVDTIFSGDRTWSGTGPLTVRMESDVKLKGWALYEDGFDYLEYRIGGKTFRCDSNPCDRPDKDGMYGMLSLEEGKDAGFGSEKDPVVLKEIRNLKGGSYRLELFSVSNDGNKDRILFGDSEDLEIVIDDGAYLAWASASECNGHRYKVFNERVSWSEAKERCESLGGHLATVTSREEQDFLIHLKDGWISCWIGLHADDEGKWNWVTGEELSFTQWDPGEPNGFPDERYGALWPINWNDLCDDSFEQEGFICEWEA